MKKIFLQINTGKETTKSGIFPEDTKDFLFFLKNEMQLSISGLMCIPPIDEDPLDHFTKLKLLAKYLLYTFVSKVASVDKRPILVFFLQVLSVSL